MTNLFHLRGRLRLNTHNYRDTQRYSLGPSPRYGSTTIQLYGTFAVDSRHTLLRHRSYGKLRCVAHISIPTSISLPVGQFLAIGSQLLLRLSLLKPPDPGLRTLRS